MSKRISVKNKRILAADPSPQVKEGAAKFPNLFSSDTIKWIELETQLIAANNYGTPATVEQANAFIEKASEEVVGIINKAIASEVKRVINNSKEDILDSMLEDIEAAMQQAQQGALPQPQIEPQAEPQIEPQVAPQTAPLLEASFHAPITASLRKAFDKTADDFMQPEIEEGTWIAIDGPSGLDFVPGDLVDLGTVQELVKKIEEESGKVDLTNTELGQFTENKEAWDITIKENWFGARLSAPGYLDATEWQAFPTREQAEEYLKETYELEDESVED